MFKGNILLLYYTHVNSPQNISQKKLEPFNITKRTPHGGASNYPPKIFVFLIDINYKILIHFIYNQ